MKSQPIFADQLLAGGIIYLPLRIDLPQKLAIEARLRRAERLVFNAEASARVGTILHDIPELLIEQMQFARAPFDLCWIEYQADVLWQSIVGKESDSNDITRDAVVGLLIDHNRVYVFHRTFHGKQAMMPFVYHLNTEWSLEDQLSFCEKMRISRLGIDQWLWGYPANKFLKEGRIDLLRALRDTTMVEIYDECVRTHPEKVLEGTSGDFKNIVALLLMLNQPSVTQYIQVPRRRGWIGNKHKPFLSHHNVEVSLDARARLVTLSESGEGELRRRHRVRGHYCHDQAARDYARIAGCIHEWEPMDEYWEPWPDAPLDEREHWKCGVCNGKRWWRVAHERGSEEKGYIEHEYHVTASV